MLPIGLDIVRSTKEFDLPGARGQSLDHSVNLVWFVAGGADLKENVQRVSEHMEL